MTLFLLIAIFAICLAWTLTPWAWDDTDPDGSPCGCLSKLDLMDGRRCEHYVNEKKR